MDEKKKTVLSGIAGNKTAGPVSAVSGAQEAPPPPHPGFQSEKSPFVEVEKDSFSKTDPGVGQKDVIIPTSASAPPKSSIADKTLGAAENRPSSSDSFEPPAPSKKFPIKYIIFGVVGLVLLLTAAFVISRVFKKAPNVSEGGEITWWGLWEENETVKVIINEYKTNHPEVEIEYIKNSPSDYRERLVSALAKGSGPDIFAFHNTWTANFSKELDSVPASFASASEFTQMFYPVIASDAASGSGLLGVPMGYDALTLYINEDLFASAEKQPPTTWSELRNTAKELTKVENDQIKVSGSALGRTENVDHWQEIIGLMLIQNGVNLTAPSGKLLEDALTYYTLFSTIDGVWDETLPNSTTMFASGRLAMYFAPSWRAFEIKEANPDLNFRTVPLPQLPKERPNEPNLSYATYWLYGISAKSKNREASWEFMKYLVSESTLEKLYQAASRSRGFGQVYPRVSMSQRLSDHPILGSVVKLAPEAKSWYLASKTHDGQNGINSQVSKYFEDAINLIIDGKDADDATKNLPAGVTQVLTQYGLVRN